MQESNKFIFQAMKAAANLTPILDNVCVFTACFFSPFKWFLWLHTHGLLNTICKYDACQLNKNVHIKNLWFKRNLASSTSFVAMAEAPQDPGREDLDSSLVTISQLQQIELATTGKSWIIPNTLLKDSDQGHQWLQIQACQLWLV